MRFSVFNPTFILISKPLSVLKALRQLAAIQVSVLGKDNRQGSKTIFCNIYIGLEDHYKEGQKGAKTQNN